MPRHWLSGHPSFPRRPAPRTGLPAGAGGEKTARLKRSIGPLRTGLAENTPQPAQPYDGRQDVDCSLRFATSKPGLCWHRQVRQHKAPETETPSSDRPPPWGIGRDAGARVRRHFQKGSGGAFRRRTDALQPPRLVWEGLEGATRPSMSRRHAAKGLAIGWGFPPRGSHANLETGGVEFA